MERRRSWYGHLAVFAVGQGVLIVVGGSWIPPAGEAPTELSGLTSVSWIWTMIFVVDTVWSLSYTVFPESKRVR